MDNNKINDKVDFDKAQVVKCKTCGADMYYDIKEGALKCPYCDNIEKIDAQKYSFERSLEKFDESALRPDKGAITYQCPNCHSKSVMHEYSTSMKCPFCGATNILKTEDMPGLAPDAILPFTVTGEQASQNALKWVKKKLYAPLKLKKTFKPENLNSVYSPAFTFDSNTYSSYEGRLGKNYTQTVGSGNNKRTVTKTKYFSVRGSYECNFDDILIEVSPKLSQKDLEKLGAFDTANAVDYDEKYIAGHASERYDTGVNQAYEIAKENMSARIRGAILSRYDYDVVEYLNVRTNYQGSTFKYLLVPLWCSAFNYRKKIYNYYINGRTGRTGGKTPVAVWKVVLTAIVIIGIIVGLYFALYK